jgi:HPt (histidine-containing phosphotransfer) domain-containing protein
MDYKFINPEYLESVTGGEISIITELVNMFKEQVVEIYTEMESLYSQHEYRQLGLLAHKAKSSVAIMGMSALADMLTDFELTANARENIEMYESYIKTFPDDTKAAVIELNEYLVKCSNT